MGGGKEKGGGGGGEGGGCMCAGGGRDWEGARVKREHALRVQQYA